MRVLRRVMMAMKTKRTGKTSASLRIGLPGRSAATTACIAGGVRFLCAM